MPLAQSKANKSNSAVVGSIQAVFDSNVTSGRPVFCIVHYYNAATSVTITDTRTGTGWVEVGSAINQGPNVITSHIFWGKFTSSGSCTVTATFGANVSYCGICVMEWDGLPNIALQGTGQSAKANSTAPSLTFTTTQATTLVIVGYLSNSGGSASFTGATIRERVNFSTQFQSNIAATDENTSAGSQTYSTTQPSGHWIIHAAEFYDAGAVGKILTGTVSGTASLSRSILRVRSATVTGSGTVSRLLARERAASVTASPGIVRQIGRSIAATVSGSATIQALRSALATMTATVAGSAQVARVIGMIREAQASVSASRERIVQVERVGNVDASPGMIRQIGKALTATITGSATLQVVKAYLVALTATVAASAQYQRVVAMLREAQASVSASRERSVYVERTASASVAGSSIRQFFKSLSGGVSLSGLMDRFLGGVQMTLTATVSMAGSVSRSIQKTVSGAIAASSSAMRAISLTRSANVSTAGVLLRGFFRSLSATITGAASLVQETVIAGFRVGSELVASVLMRTRDAVVEFRERFIKRV